MLSCMTKIIPKSNTIAETPKIIKNFLFMLIKLNGLKLPIKSD